MNRKERRAQQTLMHKQGIQNNQTAPETVPSLLDRMQLGNEYGSIVSLRPSSGDLVPETRRAIQEIEAVRGRRCLCYVANVIKDITDTSIHPSDHLPFNEMVEKIPEGINDIDVFLVTPGGYAEQVTQFVDALRSHFNSVEFILPYKAMSAGTLWALSGEEIWMDRRAFIGPVDPQVRASDGSLIPAQSLLTLLREIQNSGAAAMSKKENIPWAMIRLLDSMDHRQLGHAISSTEYVINIAADYLEKYKFSRWSTHSTTGAAVTLEERHDRALEVAKAICDNKRWKAHGHAINRDTAYSELKIKVKKIEDIPGLERVVRRLWALFCYVFDKSSSAKIMISNEYSYVRRVVKNIENTSLGG